MGFLLRVAFFGCHDQLDKQVGKSFDAGLRDRVDAGEFDELAIESEFLKQIAKPGRCFEGKDRVGSPVALQNPQRASLCRQLSPFVLTQQRPGPDAKRGWTLFQPK